MPYTDQIPTQSGDGDTISQAELQEIGELTCLVARLKKLRASVRARYEAGADVEDGRWCLKLSKRSFQRITFKALVELWGSERANRLRETIPPTIFHYLRITSVKLRTRRTKIRRRSSQSRQREQRVYWSPYD